MENWKQHTEGKIIGGNLWGGYGKDGRGSRHFHWDYQETADGWHYYGVDWSPAGYYFYVDGRLVGRVLPPERAAEANMIFDEEKGWLKEGSTSIGPVSEVEQFILVSTECHGYRGAGPNTPKDHPAGTPVPWLSQAVLPDWFEVDHVRVFDEV